MKYNWFNLIVTYEDKDEMYQTTMSFKSKKRKIIITSSILRQFIRRELNVTNINIIGVEKV